MDRASAAAYRTADMLELGFVEGVKLFERVEALETALPFLKLLSRRAQTVSSTDDRKSLDQVVVLAWAIRHHLLLLDNAVFHLVRLPLWVDAGSALCRGIRVKCRGRQVLEEMKGHPIALIVRLQLCSTKSDAEKRR